MKLSVSPAPTELFVEDRSSPIPNDGLVPTSDVSESSSIATGGQLSRCLRQIYSSRHQVLEYDPNVKALTPWKW